ncbi:putative transposase [Neisseria musculi]|uniref:Transposase n=1 Tax=Neisseria musculi TaxID=1815583 RepID=A0A7H1MAZ7_9NEIS|nr:putative insertion element IS1016 transposase [Neisseria musculi]
MLVIKKKIMPDSIVYTDSRSSCDTLSVNSFTHHRINRSKRFADHRNYKNHQRHREFSESSQASAT